MTCFAADLPHQDGAGFLVACLCVRNRQPARFVPPVYEGKSLQGSLTWLVRCTLNRVNRWRIECPEPQTSSMLLQNEQVCSIFEYAANKQLLHLGPNDLLLIDDWQAVHRFEDADPGNFEKYWQCRLPGFDLETSPFLVTSGQQSFNLINVRDFRMEVLILASAKNMQSQEAGFFKEEENGHSFHFTTIPMTEENKALENWHMMPFRKDFFETLATHRRLPITSYKAQLSLLAEGPLASLRGSTGLDTQELC